MRLEMAVTHVASRITSRSRRWTPVGPVRWGRRVAPRPSPARLAMALTQLRQVVMRAAERITSLLPETLGVVRVHRRRLVARRRSSARRVSV